MIRPILFYLLCAGTLVMASGLTKYVLSVWNQHLLLLIASAVTFGLTALFARWEKRSLSTVGLAADRGTPVRMATGFGAALLMAALQLLLVLVFGHYTVSLNPSVSVQDLLSAFTLYILVALREELVFRGYLLFRLRETLGNRLALLAMCTLFSLEHVAGGMSWAAAFFGAGTGALLFGLAALKTNGIALPFTLHTAWNFGQWCLGMKPEAGLVRGVVEKSFEQEVERNGWIAYLLIMAIAILVVSRYRSHAKSTTSVE